MQCSMTKYCAKTNAWKNVDTKKPTKIVSVMNASTTIDQEIFVVKVILSVIVLAKIKTNKILLRLHIFFQSQLPLIILLLDACTSLELLKLWREGVSFYNLATHTCRGVSRICAILLALLKLAYSTSYCQKIVDFQSGKNYMCRIFSMNIFTDENFLIYGSNSYS